jgi:hypothetical protein
MEKENKTFEQTLSESCCEQMRYREMSEQERGVVMKSMSDNFDFQSEPKAGIF